MGSSNQTRLAKPYIDKLHINNLEADLGPIFIYFKQQRQPDENFGDFCDRVGIEAIRMFVTNYQSSLSMNTDINNSSLTSINSENNMPVVTGVTEKTPDTDTKSQEESINNNLENNQELIPMNSLVTPSTTVTQTTITTPPTTTETQSLSTHQTTKSPIFSSDTNTKSSTPATVGEELDESTVVTTTPTTVGEELGQPAPPLDKPKDTSKMRHRVSVRDEIYTKLKEESKRQGKPVVQLATEAIAEYLERVRKNESLITNDESNF